MAMETVEGVYRTIEQVLTENVDRITMRLLSETNQFENPGDMQQQIGKVQGLKHALRELRNTLGYNYNEL